MKSTLMTIVMLNTFTRSTNLQLLISRTARARRPTTIRLIESATDASSR